uniref:Indoleamine 2,3-dioxygenase 2-like n=1 Tax=Scleropages formosus TaxID=113540 RepID=A0A8C9RQZ8_SCLFO
MEDIKTSDTAATHIDLESFGVSKELGFVLENPLTDLPEYYRPWMALAAEVTHLIEAHQLRDRVKEMPLLSTQYLRSHREQRLAHLALGFITMGYVWQEGQDQPAKVLPKQLAVPYCTVSDLLGLPPILVYADCVLANWKLKDPSKPMEIGNLDTVFTFPGGESCKGFLLVSLLVEKAASTGLKVRYGVAMALNSMRTHDTDRLHEALVMVTQSLRRMKECFQLMFLYCAHRWKNNPMLPDGLRYEGVFQEPLQLSGGSAAQSSAIQCFDALLGVMQTDASAGAFLKHMHDYMPPAHRALIQTISSRPTMRSYVLSASDSHLFQTYNTCVSHMVDLRDYHLNTVARYIIVPGNRARATAAGCPLRGACPALDERGTGGSNPLVFLKAVRDSTRSALINKA